MFHENRLYRSFLYMIASPDSRQPGILRHAAPGFPFCLLSGYAAALSRFSVFALNEYTMPAMRTQEAEFLAANAEKERLSALSIARGLHLCPLTCTVSSRKRMPMAA